MKPKNKVVVLNFSGMGRIHINKKNTPFLHKLSKEKGIKSMHPPQFFPDGGWYFGNDTKDHGIMFRIEYSPKTSPFKRFKKFLKILKKIDKKLPEKYKKIFRALLSEFISIITGNEYANVIKMPLENCHYFDGSFYKKVNTQENIFSVLKRKGKTFNPFIKRPLTKFIRRLRKRYNLIGDQHDMFFKELKKHDYNLHIESLCKIDNLAHKYGPKSNKVINYVKEIDSFCKKVNDYLKKNYNNYTLIIMSEHGLTDIKKIVNIKKDLEDNHLKEGRDYVVFLDSINARFWIKNKEKKKIILNKLKGLSYGKILNKKTCKRFNLPYSKESLTKYGEIIFYVKNHYLLLPNYWQGDKAVKGMHGYLDNKDPKLKGFFLFNSSKKEAKICKEEIYKKDVIPTILKLFNIKKPKTMTGDAIIK